MKKMLAISFAVLWIGCGYAMDEKSSSSSTSMSVGSESQAYPENLIRDNVSKAEYLKFISDLRDQATTLKELMADQEVLTCTYKKKMGLDTVDWEKKGKHSISSDEIDELFLAMVAKSFSDSPVDKELMQHSITIRDLVCMQSATIKGRITRLAKLINGMSK